MPWSKKRRKKRPRTDSSSDRDRDRGRAKKKNVSERPAALLRTAPRVHARCCLLAEPPSKRAQRDALVRPQQVLVESLTQIVSSLPRSSEGAEVTRRDVFRWLPAACRNWFDIKMAPVLRGTPGNQRSRREAQTLATTLDHLLTGNVLDSIMTQRGRPHSVTDAAASGGTTRRGAAKGEQRG